MSLSVRSRVYVGACCAMIGLSCSIVRLTTAADSTPKVRAAAPIITPNQSTPARRKPAKIIDLTAPKDAAAKSRTLKRQGPARIINRVPVKKAASKAVVRRTTAPIIHRVPKVGSRPSQVAREHHRGTAPRQVQPPNGSYRQGNRVARIKTRSAVRSRSATARQPFVAAARPQDDFNTKRFTTDKGRNVVRFVNSMFEKQPSASSIVKATATRENRAALPRNRERHVLLRTVVIARAPRSLQRQALATKQPTVRSSANRITRPVNKTFRLASQRSSQKAVPQSPSDKKPSKPQVAKKSDPNDPEFRPLSDVSMSIGAAGKDFPKDLAALRFARAGTEIHAEGKSRQWTESTFFWEPSALCHNPLYFEEVNLERYGYTRGKLVQPVTSAAHFFGSVVALPYLVSADRPRDCIYTLGHYRPGSYAPYRFHYPAKSTPAGIIQGGIVTGLIFAFP